MKKIVYSIILWAVLQPAIAQDVGYSMFRYAPTVTNPAQIATRNQLEVTFQHRNQWAGVDGDFRTPMATFIYPLITLKDNEPKRWGGISASFISDRQGEGGLLRTTGGTVGFAYNFDLGKKKYLSVGVQGGFYQRRLDDAALVSSFDPNFNPTFNESIDDNSVTYPSLAAGLMFYSEEGYPSNEQRYYLSASVFNINEPDVSILQNGDAPLALRGVFTGGVRAFRNDRYSIVPNLRWIKQTGERQVNIGSYFNKHFSENSGALFRYGTLGLGLWYSVENAVVASVEFNSPTFALGFSYDFNASPLGDAAGNAGATEFVVSIRKTIGKPKEERPVFEDDVPEITEVEETPTDNTSPQPVDTTRITFEEETTKDKDTTNTTALEDPEEEAAFGYNSSQLTDAQKRSLQPLIDELKANPDMVVEVRGHTCTIGTLERNQEISEDRANRVSNYMLSQGVKSEQLVTKGYNYSIPIASNATEEGRRQNRRVDFERLK